MTLNPMILTPIGCSPLFSSEKHIVFYSVTWHFRLTISLRLQAGSGLLYQKAEFSGKSIYVWTYVNLFLFFFFCVLLADTLRNLINAMISFILLLSGHASKQDIFHFFISRLSVRMTADLI